MMMTERKCLTLSIIDDMIRYIMKGNTMTIKNDIEMAKQKCYSIYLDLQATLAGQSMCDPDTLENQFNEVCAEFGLNIEDIYEWCENQHEGMFAYNGT